jgi:hypothetical protein
MMASDIKNMLLEDTKSTGNINVIYFAMYLKSMAMYSDVYIETASNLCYKIPVNTFVMSQKAMAELLAVGRKKTERVVDLLQEKGLLTKAEALGKVRLAKCHTGAMVLDSKWLENHLGYNFQSPSKLGVYRLKTEVKNFWSMVSEIQNQENQKWAGLSLGLSEKSGLQPRAAEGIADGTTMVVTTQAQPRPVPLSWYSLEAQLIDRALVSIPFYNSSTPTQARPWSVPRLEAKYNTLYSACLLLFGSQFSTRFPKIQKPEKPFSPNSFANSLIDNIITNNISDYSLLLVTNIIRFNIKLITLLYYVILDNNYNMEHAKLKGCPEGNPSNLHTTLVPNRLEQYRDNLTPQQITKIYSEVSNPQYSPKKQMLMAQFYTEYLSLVNNKTEAETRGGQEEPKDRDRRRTLIFIVDCIVRDREVDDEDISSMILNVINQLTTQEKLVITSIIENTYLDPQQPETLNFMTPEKANSLVQNCLCPECRSRLRLKGVEAMDFLKLDTKGIKKILT